MKKKKEFLKEKTKVELYSDDLRHCMAIFLKTGLGGLND
jgi:hypothetical protein